MLTEGNRNVSERRRFRGCGVGLGRLGFAGGLVRGSAASLGPIGRFRFGVKLTLGFHLKHPCRGDPRVLHEIVKCESKQREKRM